MGKIGKKVKKLTYKKKKEKKKWVKKGAEKVKKEVKVQNDRIPVPKKEETLREKSMKRLLEGNFRKLNEDLDQSEGNSIETFGSLEIFENYHKSFSERVKQWPKNPLDIIAKMITGRKKTQEIVADFGCGDGSLATKIPNLTHSFDLFALNERVTACDMRNVPLENSSVDLVVFCLSLMAKNISPFIGEANRVMKPKGTLLIVEVASRFENEAGLTKFTRRMKHLGFVAKSQQPKTIDGKDKRNSMENVFYLFQFTKKSNPKLKSGKLFKISLKPCNYKRR